MMWINIIAIIVAPIAAVWIGQMLQDRAEKRRDKVAVFKAVMTYRYGWSQEAVLALNSIPIVFAEDKTVRDRWKEYYKQLCVQNPDQMQIKQRTEALYKLIESMAATLGYKETISWEDIQNPYIPYGMATAFDNNMTINSTMAEILPQMLMSMVNSQAAPKEDAFRTKD
ncbi:MAG: hypothetical protein IJP64_05525 [Oscillospiraceae bacterium]|nr:hypothetical protein [Oscillospiraceae bacterium]